VVPAGGGSLGGLGEAIATTLRSHTLPGVAVTVSNYQGVIPAIKVEVAIDPAQYQAEVVIEAVRSALLAGLTLADAKLGQALFRSRLYAIVEAVSGVENARCRILRDGFRDQHGSAINGDSVPTTPASAAVRRVSVKPGQIVYLDAAINPPTVTAIEFTV